MKTLALVGNPNVGKSVLFNRLTGRYAAVSNYPGTTVDVSTGWSWLGGEKWRVVDTPGVNALLPSSEDERVTRDFLWRERPDVVVNVLDAKNLRRGLVLTLELAEQGIPLVVVLNLIDEAMDRGIAVDADVLSRRLGVPVASTVATTGDGVPALKKMIPLAGRSVAVPVLSSEIQRSLKALEDSFQDARGRPVAIALLAGDDTALTGGVALATGSSDASVFAAAERERARYTARTPRQILFEGREARARELVAEAVSQAGRLRPKLSQTLGRWALRPWPGYLIAAAVLYAVYVFVGVFGAGTAVDFLENTVFGAWVVPAVTRLADRWIPWAAARDFLVGPYGVVSMALSYAFALILPIVATFFIAFGLLEDSGYLPRLSVLLDRVFRLMGLNGRAVLPMILGLGCDTMATMTTRILDTRKERIIVTLLLALTVPCSAQLAVILGMAAGLSPKVLVLWLVVVIGTTLLAGWGASRVLPGARSTFLMEIPPIRRPLLRNIGMKMRLRLWWYLKEVVPLFIYGTAALFFLDRWGALKALEKSFSPVVQGFLGLPAQATEAFLIGFLRRDYGAAGLYRLQQEGALDLRQVTVSLVLITLFMPCVAQWLMMFKERGWKGALAITGAVLGIALLIAGGLNQLLHLFPGLVL
ncbi:MAG: ferrous iron transport protein B [Elusimicrobia bacterium]|jgi:ferrous iron transport protein B|nr:MAG: ferrous iron transport protein B [Elusimicrobiota bacterium]